MALDTAGEVRVNRPKRLFDFLNSRGARKACPLCGQETGTAGGTNASLAHVAGTETIERETEVIPLTCANCGFVRLQSAHVLDPPRRRHGA
jgi:predicted RNA-binding Zn-ribbon protein involved in translation (DUF1610 family)